MSEEASFYGTEPTYFVGPSDPAALTLDEYQRRAMTTCMDSCGNISYMLLNLMGEVGEFSSKVAKHIRRGKAVIVDNCLCDGPDSGLTERDSAELRKEAGDCLWQLAGLCNVMGWTLEEVARENLAKLADRKARGVIDSSGDNR